MRCLLGNDRDRLDSRGACPNDPDALAAEVHALMRPMAGVVGLALKRVDAREFGHVGRREAAGSHDAMGSRHPLAVADFKNPAVLDLVKGRRMHPRVELNVAAQVKPVCHMVDVTQDFRLRRISLGPNPLLLELLRELIRILHALHVAARTWVAVPIPGAANTAPGLEDTHGKAHSA